MYKRLSEEQEKLIALAYKEGNSYNQLSKQFDVAANTIKRIILKYGLQPRPTRKPMSSLGDEAARLYVEEKMSTLAIAKKLNISTGGAWSFIRSRLGKTRTPKEAKQLENPKGSTASNWKGGRRILKAGYVYIYKPEHPDATKAGYVMEHRLIIEDQIGRFLTKEEIVHHINGVKGDNTPSNLELIKKSEHVKRHFSDAKEVARLKSILDEHGIAY